MKSSLTQISSFLLTFLTLPAFAQFQFIDPSPGSVGLNPTQCIVIREGHELDAAVTQKKFLFSIKGSKSGNHNFSVALSNDHRTIILKPLIPFAYAEKITVQIKSGLHRADGIVISPYTFSFSTHRKFTDQEVLAFQQLHESMASEGNQLSTRLLDSVPIAVWKNSNPNPGDVFYDFGTTGKGGISITQSNGDSVYTIRGQGFFTDFKINHNGYLTYIEILDSAALMMDSSYSVIKTFKPANGYAIDVHEFQIFPDGHYYVLADQDSVVDMKIFNQNYQDSVDVIGTVIQEFDAGDHLIFEWRSFDHVAIPEALHENLKANKIDAVHTNSIEEDTDGNIIVSHRHLDQLTKIDVNTGAFIWRLGGDSNQFNFVNDPSRFNYQHDARLLPNGHITLFDNNDWGVPQVSIAKEYALDYINKTATLVWSYQHPLIHGIYLYSNSMGDVQRFADGGTFINWGRIINDDSMPSFTEIDSTSKIVWEARIFPQAYWLTYRAHRFVWTPCARPSDSLLKADAITSDSVVLSWGNATNASSYEIEYRESGSVDWDSVAIESLANEANLSNLKPNTIYEWRMKSLCNAPNPAASDYTAIKTFTTPFAESVQSTNDKEWQVYPNPANSFCTVQFPNNFQQPVEIVLEDELGKTCLQENYSGKAGTIQMSFSTIPDGDYMLKIISGNQTFVKKLMVERN